MGPVMQSAFIHKPGTAREHFGAKLMVVRNETETEL